MNRSSKEAGPRSSLPDEERALVERFRRARSDPSLAVLEGFHALKHALRFGAPVEDACAADPASVLGLARQLAPDVEEALRACVRVIAPRTLAQLAPVVPDTGLIALARRPDLDAAAVLASGHEAPVVLLEDPTHLGNVGAVVRVAAAVGAAGVLTTGRHDPWHPAALRGAAGLHYALPVARIEHVPQSPRPLIAIDPKGTPLGAHPIPPGAILAFGSERRGLSGALLERAAGRVAIPMRPGVSSLNLAIAAAVVLYAWRLRLGAT